MAGKRSVEELPEECLSHVITFTGPGDACRSSAVSGMFRGAADSDLVWDRFLPSDYREIISRSISPVEFSSKKELFAKLSSSPLLIDGATKTFSIDKYTNKRCYMLSAKELSITWSTNPLCWCWKPIPMSRFPEAIELISVCRLEILGKFNTQMLSPNTTYGAYLIIKLNSRAFGLSVMPSEVSVEMGNYKTDGKIYVTQDGCKRQELDSPIDERVPCTRVDGWLEVELGQFYNNGNNKEVKMEFREVKSEQLKGGLIVEGIELRPKH
ncbi:F-box family protein [Striga asiatica]|uniref:F-box family protein n=1 Tax=Striga asiatica TaxID=4170 RepID=A0A5A7Q870_STRAF|nr:F-box family protein [Striga asiatica]